MAAEAGAAVMAARSAGIPAKIVLDIIYIGFYFVIVVVDLRGGESRGLPSVDMMSSKRDFQNLGVALAVADSEDIEAWAHGETKV